MAGSHPAVPAVGPDAPSNRGEAVPAAVIDFAATFLLQIGPRGRLAGIEPIVSEKASRTSALAALWRARGNVARWKERYADSYAAAAFVFSG